MTINNAHTVEEGEDKDNQSAPPAKRLRGRSDTFTKDEDNDDRTELDVKENRNRKVDI